MYTDCVIVLISDHPVLRKSTSKYSKYKRITVLEYSTTTMSIDTIVKDFYTKYSKTSSRLLVVYDGILYLDKWLSLLSNSTNILSIYSNYCTEILPSTILTLRPSYTILTRMISMFCMYLSMDIFIHIDDTIGLSDQMYSIEYYSNKTMIKCKDESRIDDIQPILSNSDKRIIVIINGQTHSKSSILSLINNVDADIYLLLFCNYSIQSITKTVLQIYDPFNIESVLEICNDTIDYSNLHSYLNTVHYRLDVLHLNDGYLRDSIDDTDQISDLHSGMYKYDIERDSSIARKYRLSYSEYEDRLVVWEEYLNYYNNSLHYSSEDMIGCRLYSTVQIDEQLTASTVLDADSPIVLNHINTGVRKYNLY